MCDKCFPKLEDTVRFRQYLDCPPQRVPHYGLGATSGGRHSGPGIPSHRTPTPGDLIYLLPFSLLKVVFNVFSQIYLNLCSNNIRLIESTNFVQQLLLFHITLIFNSVSVFWTQDQNHVVNAVINCTRSHSENNGSVYFHIRTFLCQVGTNPYTYCHRFFFSFLYQNLYSLVNRSYNSVE